MSEAEIFGLWMMCKLDGIEHPTPDDYGNIYVEFVDKNMDTGAILKFLVSEGINKPVATNQDGHDI